MALAALVCALLLASVGQADDLAGVIAQRQAGMKKMGGSLKAIKAFAESGVDQAEAEAAAAILADNAKAMSTWFPVGSDLDAFPGKTAARPGIWADSAKFQAIQTQFQADVVSVQKAIAAGDKAAAATAFEALGREGCGACHGAFRAKL